MCAWLWAEPWGHRVGHIQSSRNSQARRGGRLGRHHEECGILAPCPGIDRIPALHWKAISLNHWT